MIFKNKFLLLLAPAAGIILFLRPVSDPGKQWFDKKKPEIIIMFTGTGSGELENAHLAIINKSNFSARFISIPPGMHVPEGKDQYIPLYGAYSISRNNFISRVEKLLALRCDYYAECRREKTAELAKIFGGCLYFNEGENTNFDKGLVYIDSSRIVSYTEGISTRLDKNDAEFSLWYNMFLQNSHLTNQKNLESVSRRLRRSLITDIPPEDFNFFFNILMKNFDLINISYSRLNITRQAMHGDSNFSIDAPLENGEYDRNKIREIIRELAEVNPKYRLFPLIIQVKNATAYSRIAARTAGILRYKKCNAVEYGNLDFRYPWSVLIDRSGSPLKRQYLQKAAGIYPQIYKYSYLKNFDSTVIIGEDHYAVTEEKQRLR